MPKITRRQLTGALLRLVPTVYLLGLSCRTGAFASTLRPLMADWLRDLHELCSDLRRHELSPLQWQERIEALYSRIELPELLRLLDFERLIRGIDYPHDRAEIRTVSFPAIEGIPERPGYGRKIFALQRGAAIVPHGHNNMVSAHLVLQGQFHVRTYDRVRDAPGHLILAPSIDETFRAGKLLTMSEARDNVHWLVAETDHAFTFDVPVTSIYPGRRYVTPANRYSMIHVDPLGDTSEDGHIRARVMDAREGIARFGSSSGATPVAHEVGGTGARGVARE